MIFLRFCLTNLHPYKFDENTAKISKVILRCDKGSNLRVNRRFHFKSNALTTRPSQLANVGNLW